MLHIIKVKKITWAGQRSCYFCNSMWLYTVRWYIYILNIINCSDQNCPVTQHMFAMVSSGKQSIAKPDKCSLIIISMTFWNESDSIFWCAKLMLVKNKCLETLQIRLMNKYRGNVFPATKYFGACANCLVMFCRVIKINQW